MNVTSSKSAYVLEIFLEVYLYNSRDHVNPQFPLGKMKISFTLTTKTSKRAVILLSSLNLMIPPQLKVPPTVKMRNQ